MKLSKPNFNIEINEGFDLIGLVTARERFENHVEKYYYIDYKLDIINIFLQLANKYNATISYSDNNYFDEKLSKIITAYKIYLIDFNNVIVTFKVSYMNSSMDMDDMDDMDEEQIINNDKNSKVHVICFYSDNDGTESELYKELTDIVNTNIKLKNEDSFFYTIGVNSFGFDLKVNTLENLEVYSTEHLINHYNDGLLEEYNSIKDNLKNKSHGLILLHGTPGTGKTTLIRQLIAETCKFKKIIYVPSYMVENLASPEFISFLSNYKNSVLILEDAESALRTRDSEFGAQAVSNLLNLTNGLLNDSIKIQVIATFNMDKKSIDPALTRSGRLLNEWSFEKLSLEKTNNLLSSLNHELSDEPLTVSDIYNHEDYLKTKNKKTKKQKNKVGF